MRNRHPARVSNDNDPLLSPKQRNRLFANGWVNAILRMDDKREIDFVPVVKLVLPGSPQIWLLAEIDPGEPDLAFGLCDLGDGSPKLDTVDLTELAALRGPRGLPVRCDHEFRARATLNEYAWYAQAIGKIPA